MDSLHTRVLVTVDLGLTPVAAHIGWYNGERLVRSENLDDVKKFVAADELWDAIRARVAQGYVWLEWWR